MKKIYLLLVSGLIMISCGGDGGEGEEIIVEENTAPSIPSQVYPSNNEFCADNNVLFEWNASTDNEGNTVSYIIEISEDSSFSSLLKNENTFAASRLISLEKGKSYYWRIKAIDSNKAESPYSSVIQFITEGEGTTNHVPFSPTLVSPELNSEISGTSISINWTSNDVDGDPLSFDVYFDTNENPTTLVSENQTETSYTAENLSPGTKYYVKIFVKDDKNATSIGQVWSFSTK